VKTTLPSVVKSHPVRMRNNHNKQLTSAEHSEIIRTSSDCALFLGLPIVGSRIRSEFKLVISQLHYKAGSNQKTYYSRSLGSRKAIKHVKLAEVTAGTRLHGKTVRIRKRIRDGIEFLLDSSCRGVDARTLWR